MRLPPTPSAANVLAVFVGESVMPPPVVIGMVGGALGRTRLDNRPHDSIPRRRLYSTPMAVRERSTVAEQLRSLADLLEPERDSTSALLEQAPADDEPLTPEEGTVLKEAWGEYQRGEARPLEDVLRERA